MIVNRQYIYCLMITPDFPSWSGGFAAQIHRLRTTAGHNLHQFELLLEGWIAPWRLAQQDEGPHSRDRLWNLRLTFWTFLWQIAQAGSSCREAIRQAQSLCRIHGRRPPPDENSPYCQARGGLPLDRLQQIHDDLVAEAEAGSSTKDLWCGRRVVVVDGCTVTAPDTPPNQKAYPQQSEQAFATYERYVERGRKIPNLRHVGRHAEFKYWGMPETVHSAYVKSLEFPAV